MVRVNMGVVWDRTTVFLAERAGTLVALALGTMVVGATVSGVLAPLGQSADIWVRLAVSSVTLLCLALSLLGQLAVIALALEPACPAVQAVRGALRALPGAILVTFLAVATIVLLSVPVMVALYTVDPALVMGGGRQAQLATVPPGVRLFVLIYGMLLAPIAIWLGARLTLAYPLVLGEGLGLRAIGRSVALTKGLTLKIAGVILLFGFVGFVATLAVRLVAGSVLTLLFGPGDMLSPVSIGRSLLSAGASSAWSVVAVAFAGKLYQAATIPAARGPWAT